MSDRASSIIALITTEDMKINDEYVHDVCMNDADLYSANVRVCESGAFKIYSKFEKRPDLQPRERARGYPDHNPGF